MSDFQHVSHADPHIERARAIRREHPEVRALYGRSPQTAWVALGVLVLHGGVAAALELSGAPWYAAVGLAWLVGAFCAHALFVLIHEACHRLIFRSIAANRALMLVVNLPMLLPFAIPLAHYHLVHHRAQGQRGRDPDLPSAWEVRVFGRSRLGKLAWHLLFPLLQLARTGVDPKDTLSLRDPWLVANVALQLTATAVLLFVLGLTPVLYLGLSLYFMFALHPLSGRFIQEHFTSDGAHQETHSYYGPLNRVSLNFGMHNEHHDFPAIPWHRLPALRRLAAPHYDRLHAHTSWTRLWLRFLTTPPDTLSLHHRVVREPSSPSNDADSEDSCVHSEPAPSP